MYNPNLERLFSIISSGMKPSHGYTIAEKAPEVVTAPGVYFPAERGEVIPMQSRAEGGSVTPSSPESDREKEKLGILKDILSQVRTNPNHAMESRQFGGPVSPGGEPSMMDEIEKTKYDIFKQAISALKPQKQGPVASGNTPVNPNYRAGGGINAPLLSSEKAAAAGKEDEGLRKIFSMFNTPSLPGLPKPISTESYGIQPETTKELTELIPRQAGGSVAPTEEDEYDRLRRLLLLGAPNPEGDIRARAGLRPTNITTPESLELASREKWGTPGYAESHPMTTPGFETSYYEAHPEERLMDYISEKNKPTEDLYRKLIEDERTRQLGFGMGFGPTPMQRRLGAKDKIAGENIPALTQGLSRITAGELPATLRTGIRETGKTTAPHLVQSSTGEYVWATPGRVMPAGITGRLPNQPETRLPSLGNVAEIAIARKFKDPSYLTDPIKNKEAMEWLSTEEGSQAVMKARDELTAPSVTFVQTDKGLVPAFTRGPKAGEMGEPTGYKKPLSDAQLSKVGELNTVLRNIGQTKTLYGYGTDTEQEGWVGPISGRKGALQAAYTGTASPDQVKFYSYIKDMQDALLRARSGAQINEQEYKRLVAFLPDPNLPPSTFKAKLERFEEATKLMMDEKLAAFEKGGLGVSGLMPGKQGTQKTIVERRRTEDGRILVLYSDGTKGEEK